MATPAPELGDKLKALLATKGLMSGADLQAREGKARARQSEEKALAAAGGFEVDRVVPGILEGAEDASFYLVREDFPLDCIHGDHTLGAALATDGKHISFSAKDEELSDFDPEKAVFIDTETTGLMGGTGTVTFLVGVGYFHEGHFRLDQCFMRDYDDEEPMLEYLAERFAFADTVVSFNGKSFDLPLLRTRFITNRIPFRVDGIAHFDLVHASRRFWKKRLGDCSLGNIEEQILGIRREGDVDSALIPEIWLSYLHTRDARRLESVFYHHKMDILSLVTLTGFLSHSLSVPDGKGFEHLEDRLSLVRLHFSQKRYDEVLSLAEEMLPLLHEAHLRRDCLEMMGFAAKRRSRWEAMENYWRALIEEFPRHFTARAELAKHLEHRKRDLCEAEQLCRETVKLLEARVSIDVTDSRGVGAPSFLKRLDRIQGKLTRGF